MRGSPSRAGICPRRDREGGVQAAAQEGPTRHALTLYESSAARSRNLLMRACSSVGGRGEVVCGSIRPARSG